MKTIIECGANLGVDTQKLYENHPDARIFAFKPTIELYKNTQNKLEIVKPWLESQGFKVNVNPHGNRKEADLNFFR